jgi:hypothetical protein
VDILVIGFWLVVVAIVGLILVKGVMIHMKRSARAGRQRRRQDELIVVANPDRDKAAPDERTN